MITLSRQQLIQRWDILPDSLREAMASDSNNDLLQQWCESEHVPEEKVPAIAKLTGYVLLGFMHPEELPKEISVVTGLDIKVSTELASGLNRKIFIPVKEDIDKAYAPAPSDIPVKPRLLEDIRTPARSVAPSSPSPVGAQEIKMPLPIAPKEPSRISPLNFNGSAIPPPPSQSTPISKPPITSTVSTKLPVASQPGASSQLTPVAPISSQPQGQVPAPFILHKESEFQPVKSTPDFRLNTTSPLAGKPSGVGEARPAKIELGSLGKEPLKPQIGKIETQSPHLANYGGLHSPTPVIPKPAVPSTPEQKPHIDPQAKPLAPTTPVTQPHTGSAPSLIKTPERGNPASSMMGVRTLISPELKAARLEIAEQPKTREEQKPTVINYNSYGAPSTVPIPNTPLGIPVPKPPTPAQVPGAQLAPLPIPPQTKPATQPIVIEIKQVPAVQSTSASTQGPALPKIPQRPFTPPAVSVPMPVPGSKQVPSSTNLSGGMTLPTVNKTTIGSKNIQPPSDYQPGKKFSEGFIQQPAAHSRGFFGRIVSFVKSIFSKPKPIEASLPQTSKIQQPEQNQVAPTKPSFRPGEEIIDLSSLRIVKANGSSDNKNQTGPELDGNTIKLK